MKKNNLWLEKCLECRQWRSHTGEFVPERPRVKSASDSLTKPLLKSNQQSRPTAHDSIDRSDDAVEFEELEQDLE